MDIQFEVVHKFGGDFQKQIDEMLEFLVDRLGVLYYAGSVPQIGSLIFAKPNSMTYRVVQVDYKLLDEVIVIRFTLNNIN